MWQAYRMDITANGPGKGDIAPLAPGSMPDGTMSFDELTRYLQVTGVPWTGSTTVGLNEIIADPDHTASELSQSGYRNFVNKALAFPGVTFTGNTMSDLWIEVMQTIQEARFKVGDAPFDDVLDAIRSNLSEIHLQRIQEQAAGLIVDLNKKIATDLGVNKWQMETSTYTDPSGTTWQKIDDAKTLAAHPADAAYINTEVKDFIAGYDTDSSIAKGNGVRHYDAIVALQAINNQIYKTDFCAP